MQLPDSTDVVGNLPENRDQTPNQQKDENENNDNDTNSTAVTAAVNGDADNNNTNNNRSSINADEDPVLDVSGKAWSFRYWETRRSPWTGFIYTKIYIPLSRTKASLTTESSPVLSFSFPSMAISDEIERVASSSLIRCKFGSMEAAAKVRTLEVNSASFADVKNFEYSCLGEVRILGALKHPCIVEMYGHQISSKWVPVGDGKSERRILQSILMEYIKGGSLKTHIKKLAKAGKKHVPMDFALCIACDVASALAELHSKHVIHHDIKSENILIDLDGKRVDGSPVVKLCDFDRAVPLRSFLHTCIAHLGIPPPNVCVGTPRWMAPEVLHPRHKHNQYGLEVDIWSFGCLLYELLTLQVPYSGLSELHIHDLLQMGKRPRLPEELEALESSSEGAMTQSGTEAEVETLRFLVDVFRQCTEENPADRPTAEDLYDMLLHARTH